MATGRIPTTANSPLTVKGDLFGYSTTQARVPVGNDGETLVADSSTTTGLNYKPLDAAGKNGVINGGMDIWQRGTSFIGTAFNYTADRFMCVRGGFAAGMTVSRQTSAQTGFQYAMRMQRDSGNTGTQGLTILTALETANSLQFAGKAVTVSFYARAGANYSGGSLTTILYSGTGTDQATSSIGSWTGNATVATLNSTLTTTFQRFTTTATVGSTATQLGFNISWTPTGTAGTNDWVEITGLQLELGSTATTFSRAGGTIQGELAACQRYYQKSYSTETAPATNTTLPGLQFSQGGNVLTLSGVGHVTFKSEMRVAPTVTVYSYTSSQTNRVTANDGNDQAANSGNAQYIGTRSFEVANNSGGTITSAFNGFIFHYVASAEL